MLKIAIERVSDWLRSPTAWCMWMSLWSWGSVSLVAPQSSLNRGSEGLEALGSDGFFRKIVPQVDGRGEEGHVVGASN